MGREERTHPGVYPELLGLLCWLRTVCDGVSAIRRGTGLAAGWRCDRDSRAHARDCVDVRTLFCGDHSSELEILLRYTSRFFIRDYGVLDPRRLALSETVAKLTANLEASSSETTGVRPLIPYGEGV